MRLARHTGNSQSALETPTLFESLGSEGFGKYAV
jgi:hypothetical protein